MLITLRRYTAEARELADKHNVLLLDGKAVLQMLNEAPLAVRPGLERLLDGEGKRCPKCESAMVLRTGTKGFNAGKQFWGGSNYPRCRYVLKT